jgi:DNA-binding HxlR family transcriptional regulator
MGRREYEQSCSLACALDRVGERWSMLIVRELSLGPLRFSDLARQVGGAPSDVLTKRLRDLEAHGIVRRRELEAPASGSAYELTELGRGLERPMLELSRWGLRLQDVDEIATLPPTSLANALRVILHPPAGEELTVGLRSGGRSYRLRIEAGRVGAARGEAVDADVTLAGEPVEILAALIGDEPAESGAEVTGDREALARLRAMVVLPEGMREAALAWLHSTSPLVA